MTTQDERRILALEERIAQEKARLDTDRQNHRGQAFIGDSEFLRGLEEALGILRPSKEAKV